MSFILVRIFGVIENFPGTVNFLFLLFIAFSSSLINLRDFRILIDSDFVRFMIGLSIGLTPYFELYQLLHANLYGLMIYLLFIFIGKDLINRWLFYFLIFLLFMVGIARPNLVAFLPVYILLLGISIKNRRTRDIIFYGVGTVSLSLQAYVMVMAQLFWSFRKDMGIYNEIAGIKNLLLPVYVTLNQYLRTLLAVVYKDVVGFYPLVALVCITTTFILLACYYLYRKKRYLILYYFGLSQILAFGLLYFIAFSSPVPADWSMILYNPMRWWAYSNFVIYLSLMVLFYNAAQEMISTVPAIPLRKPLYGLGVIAFALMAVLFHIYPFYRYVDPYGGHESLSNWERYRHLLKDEDYYIPVNPVMSFNWGIWKDNTRLNIDVKTDGMVNAVKLSETEGDLKLRAILIVNQGYYNSMKDLIVKAYDKEGKEIAIPRRLNDLEDKYLYYHFAERVRPYRLSFFNEKLKEIKISAELLLFGKLETGEHIIITAL